MKKLVFTFGLLMSSMVMLAIMPLYNQNNFLNVKAQEYDGTYHYYDNDMYEYNIINIFKICKQSNHL